MKRVIEIGIRSLLGLILRVQSLIKLNDKAFIYYDILFKNRLDIHYHSLNF